MRDIKKDLKKVGGSGLQNPLGKFVSSLLRIVSVICTDLGVGGREGGRCYEGLHWSLITSKSDYGFSRVEGDTYPLTFLKNAIIEDLTAGRLP